ncbi:MAG: hypothetical protein A4E48_01267 [Methanosaeta sp. PtaU1.Bin060]|nr:MAG: hypothetical protein A4E48_01267 [Methanosaeta sp. PtaU1.Bin060]
MRDAIHDIPGCLQTANMLLNDDKNMKMPDMREISRWTNQFLYAVSQ